MLGGPGPVETVVATVAVVVVKMVVTIVVVTAMAVANVGVAVPVLNALTVVGTVTPPRSATKKLGTFSIPGPLRWRPQPILWIFTKVESAKSFSTFWIVKYIISCL